jgi:hypothetical protein
MEFRHALVVIEPKWANWSQIESWAAGFRPFLRRNLPSDFADFEKLVQPPTWLALPVSLGADYERSAAHADKLELDANDAKTQQSYDRLLSFLNSLIDLHDEAEPAEKPSPEPPKPVAPSDIEPMPFRPYQRGEARLESVREYHDRLVKSALDSGFDEMELEQLGGRDAVLASIRRHMLSFERLEAEVVALVELLGEELLFQAQAEDDDVAVLLAVGFDLVIERQRFGAAGGRQEEDDSSQSGGHEGLAHRRAPAVCFMVQITGHAPHRRRHALTVIRSATSQAFVPDKRQVLCYAATENRPGKRDRSDDLTT